MNRTFKPPQYDTEHPPAQIKEWKTLEERALEAAYNRGFTDGVKSTQPKDRVCALLQAI